MTTHNQDVEAVAVHLRTTTGNAFELKLASMEEESGDSEETLEVVLSITPHIGYLWKAIMSYQ